MIKKDGQKGGAIKDKDEEMEKKGKEKEREGGDPERRKSRKTGSRSACVS